MALRYLRERRNHLVLFSRNLVPYNSGGAREADMTHQRAARTIVHKFPFILQIIDTPPRH